MYVASARLQRMAVPGSITAGSRVVGSQVTDVPDPAAEGQRSPQAAADEAADGPWIAPRGRDSW